MYSLVKMTIPGLGNQMKKPDEKAQPITGRV